VQPKDSPLKEVHSVFLFFPMIDRSKNFMPNAIKSHNYSL